MPTSQLRHTKCAQAPLPSFVYVEDAQPLAIALNDLAIVDVTDAQLGAAYVRLQPLVAGDELAVRDDVAQTAGFAWHFNRQSGELLVLRKKPIGDYVKLLRDALTFHTASQLPDTRRRTVLMQVEDAGEGQPFPMRSTSGSFKDGFTEVGFIDVISVNDPIIFGAADASTARKFIAGRAPAMLLPNVTVHDADNATVVSLTISVDAGFERGSDLLVFDGRTDWGGLAPPVVTAANASLSLELAPAAAGAAGAGALAQYRSALNFSAELLDQAQATLDSLYSTLRDVQDVDVDMEVSLDDEPFYHALNDDLNTPVAIAEIHALAKQLHKAESQEKPALKGRILAAGNLLGILEQDAEAWLQGAASDDEISAEAIDALIVERQESKLAKDYGRADEIRQELLAQGVVLEDSREGTKWKRG